MKTNGYLDMSWTDLRLQWNPDDYGGITVLRLPVDKVWQPDIVLTNTVDGQFWPNFKSNALIYSAGTVFWVPPFIYKSGCDTNPLYFPFDQQECYLVFRSVTYNARDVDIQLKAPNMELKDYCEQPSGTWDLAEVPLGRLYRMEWYREGKEPVVFVQLDLKVARKSQFYVITFLLPCVCIAFLTIFVFYLPTAAGEKICLAISILFTIVVFLLILTDILPPSDSLPLMTKFLLFTFVCNLISTFITVITINWNFRSPDTHEMPDWVKLIFLNILPRMLRIKRPEKVSKRKLFSSVRVDNGGSQFSPPSRSRSPGRSKWGSRTSRSNSQKLMSQASFDRMIPSNQKGSPIVALRFNSYRGIVANNPAFSASVDSTSSLMMRELQFLGEYLSNFPGYRDALQNVAFIAKNVEEGEEGNDVADDWKYIALVIDRLLLWLFFLGNAFGSVSILLNSPHLFEPLTDHCPNRTTLL
ncbi:acetylcholine receptor subunit beta-type lev-1-like isoform X2 [Paramacrobiotus metropolitanus]|nr:acetylcholine receptor subunit beta-type lev-1-like isoform X2 [Paramacrobiotus metropolitanus]